jgi:hypothetical protein
MNSMSSISRRLSEIECAICHNRGDDIRNDAGPMCGHKDWQTVDSSSWDLPQAEGEFTHPCHKKCLERWYATSGQPLGWCPSCRRVGPWRIWNAQEGQVLFSRDLPPLVGMQFFGRWTVRPYWLGRICQGIMRALAYVLWLLIAVVFAVILSLPLPTSQYVAVYIVYIISLAFASLGIGYMDMARREIFESVRAW